MTLLLQVCPRLHIKPHVLVCCLHAGLALQLLLASYVSCICALTSGVKCCLVHDSILPPLSLVIGMLASDLCLLDV